VDDVGAAVERVCCERGVARLLVPSGVPAGWRPASAELVGDTLLTPAELDGVDGVLTGCTVAIAETGTIALSSGPRVGRRALTLVPDLHVCVVEQSQIVELVPEATAILGALVAAERRPVTLVSGPSATSDIELSRVEGVHGPRHLVVLVVKEVS
jgi:L-lactate dehydrogenase complex protein LldG